MISLSRSVAMHVHPDGRPVRRRAKLHQVAQLVGQPQTAPTVLGWRRSTPVSEWIIEVSAVAQLANENAAVAPDAKRARATAVLNAVGSHLVGGKHQVRDRSCGEPGARRFSRHQAPDGWQPDRIERKRRTERARLR